MYADSGNNVVTVPGTVNAGDEGLFVSGDGNEITVSGTVIGEDLGVYALGSANEVRVTDGGTVVGGSNQDGADVVVFSAAVGFFDPLGHANRLVIDGTLIAEENPDFADRRVAVLDGLTDGMGSSDLTILNNGLIDGEVLLGQGTDLYDGSGGAVSPAWWTGARGRTC